MRKPRVIIYDDSIPILGFMTEYLEMRGYEVMTFDEPMGCPIYDEDSECAKLYPCADIVLTDLEMPKMSGIEMLKVQTLRGCRVLPGNRALMSGSHIDEATGKDIGELGVKFFPKPLCFHEFSAWLDQCEQNIDLSRPVAIKRQSERHECHEEVKCLVPPHNEVVNGICINSSESGLCLKIGRPVFCGQHISVHSSRSHAVKAASVRWIKEIEGSYVAGVQYA